MGKVLSFTRPGAVDSNCPIQPPETKEPPVLGQELNIAEYRERREVARKKRLEIRYTPIPYEREHNRRIITALESNNNLTLEDRTIYLILDALDSQSDLITALLSVLRENFQFAGEEAVKIKKIIDYISDLDYRRR